MPNRVTPEQVKQGRGAIDELAEAAGRDPSSIQISVFGQASDRDLVLRLAEAGADRVTIMVETAPAAETMTQLESIAAALLK